MMNTLEAQAIYDIREFIENAEDVGLISCGDLRSIAIFHLSYKAYYPGKIPLRLYLKSSNIIPEMAKFFSDFSSKFNISIAHKKTDATSNCFIGNIDGNKVKSNPLSSWREIDLWNYVKNENINLPDFFFAHSRMCLQTENLELIAMSPEIKKEKNEHLIILNVRFTAEMKLVQSNAKNVEEVIAELIKENINTVAPQTKLEYMNYDNAAVTIIIQTRFRHNDQKYFGGRLISGELKVGQNVFIGDKDHPVEINSLYLGNQSSRQAKTGDSITFSITSEAEILKGDLVHNDLSLLKNLKAA